jgi:miniconductance mechanosensitive channel
MNALIDVLVIGNVSQSLGALDLRSWGDCLVRFVILVLIAMTLHWISRRVLLRLISRVAAHSKNRWDDILVEHHVFSRVAHIAPALVFYYGAHILLPPLLTKYLENVAFAYMGLMAVVVVVALLNAANAVYRTYPFSKGRNIKGLIQMVQVIAWLFGGILIIAHLRDVSALKFLGGLGALSAIVLLVFKDSILGLVASIQVSANDMVQVGDWIEMPKYGADGDVIDISLNTVKVQNWDKTISTIPTYALVADPVKNWRGMSESGGRRIKRAVNIDMNTAKFCTEEMLDRFERFELLQDYLKERRAEVNDFNRDRAVSTDELINGRRLTNLGCFRAYLVAYLRNHPMISDQLTFLVRHLAPTDRGLPIEVYVFSTDQKWANYESIQADIFDHLLAAIPEFDLSVFQSPSGRDFQSFAHTKEN